MDKIYTICLSCGKVQLRTDIVENLDNKIYVFSSKKILCPKCRKETQAIATKNLKTLKKALSNSNNKLEQKLSNYIG